jgi:ribose transport system ATP-binding protein
MASLNLPDFSRFKILRRGSERRVIRRVVEQLQLRPPNIERAVAFLSGGNRQKVMLMRGLTRDVRIFLFDEPTVGIDVGAKTEVYELIKKLAENGAAILLISSELPEVINLCNRVYVMHQGRLIDELEGKAITETNVLASFFEEGEHIGRFATASGA